MIIAKEFLFDASHLLPGEIYGKCSNLHGHTYRLIVEVEGSVNLEGWVCNFTDLKKIVNEKIISFLDHSHLNDLVYLPTAENILFWIFNELHTPISETLKLKLYSLTLWETPTSYAKIIC